MPILYTHKRVYSSLKKQQSIASKEQERKAKSKPLFPKFPACGVFLKSGKT